MRNKKKLTEELVKQLDPELGLTVKRSLHTWWFNIRNNGGMRLTGPGFQTFVDDLELEHYSYSIDNPHCLIKQLF